MQPIDRINMPGGQTPPALEMSLGRVKRLTERLSATGADAAMQVLNQRTFRERRAEYHYEQTHGMKNISEQERRKYAFSQADIDVKERERQADRQEKQAKEEKATSEKRLTLLRQVKTKRLERTLKKHEAAVAFAEDQYDGAEADVAKAEEKHLLDPETKGHETIRDNRIKRKGWAWNKVVEARKARDKIKAKLDKFEEETMKSLGGGAQFDVQMAKDYLRKAGGDVEKAKEMARQDGHTWE